jgi:hypothetical protein
MRKANNASRNFVEKHFKKWPLRRVGSWENGTLRNRLPGYELNWLRTMPNGRFWH